MPSLFAYKYALHFAPNIIIQNHPSLVQHSACASLIPRLDNYMASAQVDAVHVEDLTKSSEEPTLDEGSAKAPAPQNIESPYDEEPEDVILSDELGKEDELDDEEDKKGVAPQIIEDEDDDDDEDDEEQATKSAVRAGDFSEEDGDDDV